MSKQPKAKQVTKPAADETLNGSNTLPALVEIADGKGLQLGVVVAVAHQLSGLTVEAWNALTEAERDERLNTVIADIKATHAADALPDEVKGKLLDIATGGDQALNDGVMPGAALTITSDQPLSEGLLAAVQNAAGKAVIALGAEGNDMQMIVAKQVLIVSAPGGPRRRAGFSFGPVPVELRAEDLGDDPAAVLELLRGDPLLKIDGRFEESPADDD